MDHARDRHDVDRAEPGRGLHIDQPYERTITTWPDQPADRTALETRTRDALESGEYRMLDPWLAYQFDEQTYEDPTEDEEQRDDCRPPDSIPSGDPAPSRGTQDFLQDPERWRARYETVPESQFPPGSSVPEGGPIATGATGQTRLHALGVCLPGC